MHSKYRELGLPLIPLRPASKAPSIERWTDFCDRLPTEAECDAWDASGNNRYGLVLGPASGVLGVDIDSDDVNVLNAVKPSPVRKRGKKGETRFFRFDPGVPSCKVGGCIDILSYGRQTVMPPTTHPDTGLPYVWLTPDTLENMAVADLPLFTPDDLSDLRRALEPGKWEQSEVDPGVALIGGPWRNDDPRRGCPHGSHDRLKRIVGALVARGASPDEAVRELLHFDEENHFPVGYFRDMSRPDCFADPVSNALFFYASNLRTFNRREAKAGRLPVVPLVSGSEILEVSSAIGEPTAFKPMPLPEPEGLVRTMRDLIAKSSVLEQPGLSMIGAISVCSVLVANRYKLGDAWPNLYSLAIAPTGSGKSFPVNAAMRLLAIDRDTGLFGKEQVLSGQALIKGLESQRERLDIVDECSNLFNTILKGGVFQADILAILLKLYSQSSGLFIGPESKGSDPVRVFHPCISSMMLTNREDFIMSVTKGLITGGLFPRFLTFVEWGYGQENPDARWDEMLAARAMKGVDAMLGVPIEEEQAKRNLLAPRPAPREARASKAATDLLKQYGTDCRQEITREDTEEVRRHFLTRAPQNAQKLALIHGILHHGAVEESDARWAVAMVEACLHNSMPLYAQIAARTPAEAAIIGVLEVIKRAGFISVSKLYEQTRILTRMQRNEALDALQIEGKIRAVNNSKGRGFESL